MNKKLISILLVTLITGCNKKEVLNPNIEDLGGATWVKSPLDEWLNNNFTTPYNIEVKYKWDRSELPSGFIYRNVMPVKEDKVIPVMNMLKKTWLDPYTAITNEMFMKKYAMKQIFLGGSPIQDSNLTGLAEGGNKVLLLNVNFFDLNDKPALESILHTVHHEFGHILNHKKMVSHNYEKITAADYSMAWSDIVPGTYATNPILDDILYQAHYLGKGFITPYAMSNQDEDFVEMLAYLLVKGKAYFNNTINNLFIYEDNSIYIKKNSIGVYLQNTDARNKLLKKQALVISYLKDSWGIELDKLQAKVNEAIETFAPTPDFNTLLGPEKIYTKINITPQKTAGLSSKFLSVFNTSNNKMLAAHNPFYIDNISLIFDKADEMTLRINYLSPVEPPNAGLDAHFNYKVTNKNGVITLKYINPESKPTNANASAIEKNVTELLTYFNNQSFNVRWVDDIIPQSKGLFGGLVNAADPTSYLFGTL